MKMKMEIESQIEELESRIAPSFTVSITTPSPQGITHSTVVPKAPAVPPANPGNGVVSFS